MARYRLRPILLSATLMAVILMTCPLAAQNYWMYPGGEKSISFEVFKPKFAVGEGYTLLNSVWFLSGHFQTSDRISIMVDLPIVQMDVDSDIHPSDEDQTLIGNPYLGLVQSIPLADSSQLWLVGIGARIPLASDEKWPAVSMGWVTMYNRFEAFVPDLASVNLRLGYLQMLESGLKYTINVDGALMIPTKDGDDTELFIDYNASILLPVDKVSLSCGFAGRMFATADDGDFSEITAHQLGFAGTYDFGTLKPGFNFRLPLDDNLTYVIDYVYGLSLTYNVP